MTPRKPFCALVLCSIVIWSCSGVPPEVMTGVAYQDEAWKNIKANAKTVILAYDRELRASYDAQLDAYFETRMMATSQPESMPASYAVSTYKAVMERRKAIYADLDKKRDEFLADQNIAIGTETAAVLGQYLRTTQEGYDRIKALIDTVKGVAK